MSILKHVTLFRGTNGVDPMLTLALNKLVAHNSNYTFEGISANNDKTNGVVIYDGVDKVGTIEFGNHQGKANSNGVCEPAFAVGSPRVQKQRGNRGKIITADIGAAVRQAKKLLARPDIPTMAEETIRPTLNKIRTEMDRAESSTRNAFNFNSTNLAFWLADSLSQDADGNVIGFENLRLSDIPTQCMFTVKPEIFTTAYKHSVLQTMLVDAWNAVVDGQGAFARRLRGDGVRLFETTRLVDDFKPPEYDNTALVDSFYVGHTSPSGGVKHTGPTVKHLHITMTDYPSLESSPEWVKEKIATLALTEHGHAIPNIGIKVQNDKDVDVFFIYRKQFLEDEGGEGASSV